MDWLGAVSLSAGLAILLLALMRFQNSAWGQIRQHRFFDDQPGAELEASGEDRRR